MIRSDRHVGVVVLLPDESRCNLPAWMVDPAAQEFPFAYDADEQVELVPYRLPSYPHDGPALQQWLRQIPEDPAGLLRRKFMVEHLKRKRQDR